MTDRPSSRRGLLAAGGSLATALLAGCSDLLGGGATTVSPTVTATGTGEVVEVDVVGLHYTSDGASYALDVTLEHGSDRGGADWWQVETLDGRKLGRKRFDPPRSNARFTTSATVEIPDDVGGVVVRGHGVAADYGGQVVLADVDRGRLFVETQGSEPSSFADYTFPQPKDQ